VTPARAPSPPNAVAKAKAADIAAMQILSAALEGLLRQLIAQNQVSVVAQPLTLTISLNASVLFPTGQAMLTKPATALLSTVATSLKAMPSKFGLVVQGFTDNQPIDTAAYPSNWSLSAERAVSVVELFTKDGMDGQQISAQGYGEFSPIASNASDAGRATNRRVVIVIKAPDASSVN